MASYNGGLLGFSTLFAGGVRRLQSGSHFAKHARCLLNGSSRAGYPPLRPLSMTAVPVRTGIPGQVDLGLGFPPTRGLVFDMDGTLVEPSIDFGTMRKRVEIPEGDLFNQMERWNDPERVGRAMDVINELERDAVSDGKLVLASGLHRLLQLCDAASLKVALVTRNTTPSVNTFLGLLSKKDASLFELILTREFRHVKPDKRIMENIADQWGMHPSELVMIGDSKEDVEVGNAGGSMSCLVLGGGNETKKVAPSFIKEGLPTFKVDGLDELAEIVQNRWQSATVKLPYASTPRTFTKPLEMDFMDHLVLRGFVKSGYCTYPRLTAAFGCEDETIFEGDQVLHYGCGDGFLTKLFGSLGLETTATDTAQSNISMTQARGLDAANLDSIEPKSHDAAVAFAEDWLVTPSWAQSCEGLKIAMANVGQVIKPGGTFALEFPIEGNAVTVAQSLTQSLSENQTVKGAFCFTSASLDMEAVLSTVSGDREWILVEKGVVLHDIIHQTVDRLAEDVVDQCGRTLVRLPDSPAADDMSSALEAIRQRIVDGGQKVSELRRVRIVLRRV